MGTGVQNLIKSEYERRQKAAYDSLMQRRNEVYVKIPRIQEIENDIHLSGLRYNKMILLGQSSDDTAVLTLLSRIEKLRAEKLRLLAEAGYAAEYLEPVYQCPKCKDTGIITSGSVDTKCACYRQQLINNLYSQSNLKLTETENFSTFDENYYTDLLEEGNKKSPRNQILEIKDSCLSFINNFNSPEQKNLFFCGRTGVGKTFMANCIASELINRGITVLYQSAPSLFSIMSEHKMRSFREEELEDTCYKDIFDVELLIIDDLGTESLSAARYADFLTILNTRQINNNKKPCKTIISTNIDIMKMYDYYDERIVSRIIGNFDMYRFPGDDIRKQKVLNGR